MDLREWWTTAEWWTYHPSNFVMFSPRIYWRLFESINAAYGPVAWVLVALAVSWLALRMRARLQGSAVSAALFARLPLGVLAVCWLFVAWAFMFERYAAINWPARYFGAAFVLEAALLGGLAAANGLRASAGVSWRSIAGIALALWALLGHPLLAFASGRSWRQAEVFGLAPDPTAIATLGLLLLVEVPDAGGARRLFRVSLIVPILWCAVSAATLGTLGLAQAWIVAAAPILAMLGPGSTRALRSR